MVEMWRYIPAIQMTLVLPWLERTLFCRVQTAKWKTNRFHVYCILRKYWVHIQLTLVKEPHMLCSSWRAVYWTYIYAYKPGTFCLALFRTNHMIRLHQTPDIYQHHIDEPVQCKLLGPASVVFQWKFPNGKGLVMLEDGRHSLQVCKRMAEPGGYLAQKCVLLWLWPCPKHPI